MVESDRLYRVGWSLAARGGDYPSNASSDVRRGFVGYQNSKFMNRFNPATSSGSSCTKSDYLRAKGSL